LRARQEHPVVLVDAFESGTAGQWRTFTSLLSETAADLPADTRKVDPAVLSDLNLDRVISAVAGDREERDLISQLLSRPRRWPWR
jgi:hypothetical protein